MEYDEEQLADILTEAWNRRVPYAAARRDALEEAARAVYEIDCGPVHDDVIAEVLEVIRALGKEERE